MNRYDSHILTFQRWASILGGLLLVVFAGFYFFNVSAKTEAVEKTVTQNLVSGKIAFTGLTVGMTTYESRINTINPDGTGGATLPIPLTQAPGEQAWSPDGTKLVYVLTQTPVEIYSVNADGSGRINLTNTPNDVENNPAWSATGKIAYERGGQIWTMNADGSGQAQFSAITQTSPIRPAWSFDGSKLAFASGGEIWVINADGTNQQRVTTNTSSDSEPAWSPDGSKIVFAKGGSGISVINADGTNETPLTTGGGTQPSWSSDGTKIAFALGGIYTMDTDGTNQVRIFTNIRNFPLCCDTNYSNPTWQPVAQTPNTFSISGRVSNSTNSLVGGTVNLSGTINAATTTDAAGNYQFINLPAGGNYTVSPSFLKTYFTPAKRSFTNLSSNQTGNFEVRAVCQGGKCARNGKISYVYNGEIYAINPDGTNDTNLTNNAATDKDPNYSLSGTEMAFSTNRDGNYEIYRMSESGLNPVRLTNNTATDSLPYFSPDDSTIIFVSNRDGNNEIYKMNVDGSNQIRLTNNSADDTEPSFSPDGSKIIFTSRRDTYERIFIMNADGSNQQLLFGPNNFAPCYDRPIYSPDGAKIIFGLSLDCGTTHRSISTINADGSNFVQSGFGRFPTYSPDGLKIASVCCYFDPFNNPPRMSSYNVSGGSNLTYPKVLSASDETLPDWQGFRVARAPYDFDGDGRSDISVFRPSNGAWYLLRSTEGLWTPQWGLSTDKLAPADYDGDLKTDVAVWRPSDGNFYILNSFDSTVRIENFGLDGDIPTGGDWDGDGKADPAVYRGGANGTFYYRGSMGNPNGNITFLPWGVSGDKPVAGDYDGDGLTDAAIFRPSNGTWYIRQSSNGQLLGANFGLADDTLVPADYDADGKTDIAVYRAGIWYLLRSAQGFAAFQFGVSNDIPAPADYDGDGRVDAAIYRNGVWWILNSQSGAANAVSFGVSDDAPVPSAFVR